MFVPGNQDKHLNKVSTLQADVIIYDLEDAVPNENKSEARKKVKEIVQTMDDKENYVRVNELASPYFIEDLEGILDENVTGIVLPKVDTRDDVVIADYFLSKLEEKYLFPINRFKIVPIIETARGVENVKEIAASSDRITCLSFGAEDFMLDVNMESSGEQIELNYARSKIVIASKAAGKEAPIDTVYTNFRDNEGLEAVAKQGRKAGFQGKLIIHPNQIETVNRVFAPSDEELEEAKKIVQLYEKSLEEGLGAVQLNGKMIDVPVAERAKKLLAFTRPMEIEVGKE